LFQEEKHMNRQTKRIVSFLTVICGLAAVFLIRRNLSAEASLAGYFGMLPDGFDITDNSAGNVVQLFTHNLLAGLLFANFFDVINLFLVCVLITGAVIHFELFSKPGARLTVILFAVSFGIYLLTNDGLRFWLSGGAAESFWNTGFLSLMKDAGLFLFYLAGLLAAILFHREHTLSRFSFVCGLLANGIGLLYFPLALVFPEYGYFAIVLAAPFTVTWQMNLVVHVMKGIGRFRKSTY